VTAPEMTGHAATLPTRMRAGRLAQVERQLERIAQAVEELREIVARMRAANAREK